MTEVNPYTFTDNPTESGVAVCDTDILNDDIMCLKWMHDHITYRTVGEQVKSYVPLTDAGLHPTDGDVLTGGGIYDDCISVIKAKLNTNPEMFTTESDWQTSVTNYGVCNKFVYTAAAGNNPETLRLPKTSSDKRYLIKSYINDTDWYNIYSDGWCEQGGFVDTAAGANTVNLIKPYLTSTYSIILTNKVATNSYAPSVYSQNASTFQIFVQDATYDVYWQACGYVNVSDYKVNPLYEYIVVGSLVKTDIQVDIDEIATDLNGKVDKANLIDAHCVIETYINGTSWYRLYSDGWCEQGGYFDAGTTTYNPKTIDLYKSYIDTNYSVFIELYNEDYTGGYAPYYMCAHNKTTSSFQTYFDTNIQRKMWMTCGYVAS